MRRFIDTLGYLNGLPSSFGYLTNPNIPNHAACVPCYCLTLCNKAVLWFFFDLKWLLFILGLVLVTASS